MTKEQAMQALEQAGRKGSDAYAELAALEKQTPSGIKETTHNVEDWSKDVESTAKRWVKFLKQK